MQIPSVKEVNNDSNMNKIIKLVYELQNYSTAKPFSYDAITAYANNMSFRDPMAYLLYNYVV